MQRYPTLERGRQRSKAGKGHGGNIDDTFLEVSIGLYVLQ